MESTHLSRSDDILYYTWNLTSKKLAVCPIRKVCHKESTWYLYKQYKDFRGSGERELILGTIIMLWSTLLNHWSSTCKYSYLAWKHTQDTAPSSPPLSLVCPCMQLLPQSLLCFCCWTPDTAEWPRVRQSETGQAPCGQSCLSPHESTRSRRKIAFEQKQRMHAVNCS